MTATTPGATPNITQLAGPAATTGRQGWLAHTWHLTVWTLYTVRRRALSKWLGGIFVGLFALLHGLLVLSYLGTRGGQPGENGATAIVLSPLTFPTSLSFAGSYMGQIGLLCFVILAGATVGGEYGAGTVRIWLSRGVGRAQMIAAQVAALALLALAGTAILFLMSALAGVTLGPALGATIPALPEGAPLQIVWYWLAVSAQVLAYGMLALFLATLTRSTPAGIGIPLGYLFIESIASNLLFYIGTFAIRGDLGTFVAATSTWLLGTNAGVLVARVGEPLFAASVGTSPDVTQNANAVTPQGQIDLAHAVVFVIVYGAVFAVASWLVLRRRDITD